MSKAKGAILFLIVLMLGMALGLAVGLWMNPEPTATSEYRQLALENRTLKQQISDLQTRVAESRTQTREKVNRIAAEVHKRTAPMSLNDLRDAFLRDLSGSCGTGPGPAPN